MSHARAQVIVSFPAPDYALMESLVQRLLEQLRAVNAMIAAREDAAAILRALSVASVAHERLVEAMQADALNAHAAGHIFAVLLGERLGVLRHLAVDMRNATTSSSELVADSDTATARP
jgi:hypothetical protein